MNRLAVAAGLTVLLIVPLIAAGGGQPVVSTSISGPETVSYSERGEFQATVVTRGDTEIESARIEVVDRLTNGTSALAVVDDDDALTVEPVWTENQWVRDRERPAWAPTRDRGADARATPGREGGANGSAAASGAAAGPTAAGNASQAAREAAFAQAGARARISQRALERLSAVRWAVWTDGALGVSEYVLWRSLDVTREESPEAGYGYGYGGDGGEDALGYRIGFDGDAFVPGGTYGLQLNVTTTDGEHFTSDVTEFDVAVRSRGGA